jgi:hypothetical protein
MTEKEFQILLEQYITGNISSGNREVLLSMLNDAKYKGLLEMQMENEWNSGAYEESPEQTTVMRLETGLMQKLGGAKVVPLAHSRIRWLNRIAVAAVLVLLIGGGYFLFKSPVSGDRSINTIAKQGRGKTIVPGSNKAFLLLGNGDTLKLDDGNRGVITEQGSTRLEQRGGGLLTYEHRNGDQTYFHNTIFTPNGGQFQVRLADGTNVWLNAGSSLHFPTAFVGDERIVQLTGEAYFEVAHNADKPFKVEVDGMHVKVLGTHFNINSYRSDSVWRTTLVQGKIEISNGQKEAVLTPGNQARIESRNRLSIIQMADTGQAIAWKNGFFQFKNAEIKTVMGEISRWYDVEIVYKGLNTEEHFTGTISRDMPTHDLLRLLDVSGIHCKIEYGKIVVMP